MAYRKILTTSFLLVALAGCGSVGSHMNSGATTGSGGSSGGGAGGSRDGAAGGQGGAPTDGGQGSDAAPAKWDIDNWDNAVWGP